MADGFPQAVVGSCFCFAQQGFELGEGLFDGVEVWRVTGQEQHPGSACPDGVSGARAFVNVEIVPDHHIARFEERGELGDHPGIEGLAVDGAVYHPGRHQFIASQRRDECLGVPFAEGCIGDQPLALLAAPPQRRHVGLDTGLINEQQPPGGGPDGWQAMFVPLFTLGLNVGAFAFRRQQRFFYSCNRPCIAVSTGLKDQPERHVSATAMPPDRAW